MRPLALAQLTNTSTGLDRLHVLKGWLKQLNDMGVVSGLQVRMIKAEIARAEGGHIDG
jgi:hypothetical protein